MDDFFQRMQKLEDIFKLPEKMKSSRVSDMCFNGLKTLFPNHEWEFKRANTGEEVMFFCDTVLVFNNPLNDHMYKENILTFTENFILEEKLNILLDEE